MHPQLFVTMMTSGLGFRLVALAAFTARFNPSPISYPRSSAFTIVVGAGAVTGSRCEQHGFRLNPMSACAHSIVPLVPAV